MRIRHAPPRSPRTLLASTLLVLLVAVASCDGEFPAVADLGEAERASEVIVTPLDQTASIGETRDFHVEVRNQHGAVMPDAEVAWSSAAPGVAAVDDGGLAQAITAGTAPIEAVSGEARGRAHLIVRKKDQDDGPPSADSDDPGEITDLRATGSTVSSIEIAFTEVDDGLGNPAHYEVRYAVSSLDPTWDDDYTTVAEGTCADPLEGDQIEGTLSCNMLELEPGTEYRIGLVAYRHDPDGNRMYGPPSNQVSESTDVGTPGTVTDLRTTGATSRSIQLAFTEVNDGTGNPAFYRVRYAPSDSNPSWPDDYTTVSEGACAIPVQGSEVGGTFTCSIPGLTSGVDYEFGLIAYRYDSAGSRVFGQTSNIATGNTDPPSVGGIWLGASALSALPMSGPAWENVKSRADGSCPRFELSDQDNNNNTCVMAKALVYARTGDAAYLTGVTDALRALSRMGRYDGRALALGRNLGAYAIAADLIGLSSLDPDLDASVRGKFRELLTTSTYGAASNLVDCHERRPNNWGTHCGGARAAVAAYLRDSRELERVAQVFKGWLGDRSSYDGFAFGGGASNTDHSWECDQRRPVGINPRGCRKAGRNLDGVIPDDQRRGGSFDAASWPPSPELYVWEALQGVMMQGIILEQAGYPAFQWEDRAILRAVTWLHDEPDFAADRGNTWQPHVVNHYYGTSFPAPSPTRVGKNVGWTDWTHR